VIRLLRCSIETLDELSSLRDKSVRTWVVYTFPPVVDAIIPDVMSSIRNEFMLINQFGGTVSNGTVYVVRDDGSSIDSNHIYPDPGEP
jgi:hypothetical protein